MPKHCIVFPIALVQVVYVRLLVLLKALSSAATDSQRYVFISAAVARSLSQASSEKQLVKVRAALRVLERAHNIDPDTR